MKNGRRVPSWRPILVVAALALLAALLYDVREFPILRDRAYFVYLSQTVLRGESVYRAAFIGYPPLPFLLSGATMWGLGWFGVPTYLAPRFAGIAILVASAGLVYAATRQATGRWGPAAGATLALLGFANLTALCVANLEPKALVVCFSLATALAIQRRRWGAAGLASALAASCWPPAGLVALASLAVALAAGRPRWPAALRWALGIGTGLLPSIVYITVTRSWWDFFQRAFVVQAGLDLEKIRATPFHWLGVAANDYGNEILFFLLAGLGLLLFAARSLRGAGRIWIDPRFGGFPLLTLGWLVFNSLDFQGPPDMLPILPLVAFWFGWTCAAALRGLARHPAWERWVSVVVVSGVGVYALADAALYRHPFTLSEELKLVRGIVERAGPDETVISLDVPEIYALSERRAPLPFLSLTAFFVPNLHLVGFAGCDAVRDDVIARRPAVVVIQRWRARWIEACMRSIGAELPALGYTRRRTEIPEPRFRSYLADPRMHPTSVWDIFHRKRESGEAQDAGNATFLSPALVAQRIEHRFPKRTGRSRISSKPRSVRHLRGLGRTSNRGLSGRSPTRVPPPEKTRDDVE